MEIALFFLIAAELFCLVSYGMFHHTQLIGTMPSRNQCYKGISWRLSNGL
jgi:hypothetical protein